MEDACCVCLDEDARWVDRTRCGHTLCMRCLIQLRDARCPMCRAPLSNDVPSPVLGVIERRMDSASSSAEDDDDDESWETTSSTTSIGSSTFILEHYETDSDGGGGGLTASMSDDPDYVPSP